MSKFTLTGALALGILLFVAGSNFMSRLGTPASIPWYLAYVGILGIFVVAYGLVCLASVIHRLLKRRR